VSHTSQENPEPGRKKGEEGTVFHGGLAESKKEGRCHKAVTHFALLALL
jgi:hypothetical protein